MMIEIIKYFEENCINLGCRVFFTYDTILMENHNSKLFSTQVSERHAEK